MGNDALILRQDVETSIERRINPLELATVIYPRVQYALETASTPEEVSTIRAQIGAVQEYIKKELPKAVKDRKERFEITFEGDKLYCESSAKLGSMWGPMEDKAPEGRPPKNWDDRSSFIHTEDYFSSRRDATRCVRASEIDEQDREVYYEGQRLESQQPTVSGLEQYYFQFHPHVSYNSGENEWYTPPEYIEAARRVMGEIDLDPASSDIANKIVKAKKYYTIDDDGLYHDWQGRVWMNPPYASELIGEFCDKLVRHFSDGDVSEAIVLVNNATETAWFSMLISEANAIVFPRGRVRFLTQDKETGAPLQGQAVIYLGNNPEKFIDEFTDFGWCAEVCKQ